jgi:hypothetical protein
VGQKDFLFLQPAVGQKGFFRGKPQYHLREIFTIGYFTWKTPVSFPWDFYDPIFYVENPNIIHVRFLRLNILRGKLQYKSREIITLRHFTWKTPISFPWDFYDPIFYVENPNIIYVRFLRLNILRGKLQYHSREIFTIRHFTWKTPISLTGWKV